MADAASAASAGRLLAKLHGQLDSVAAPNGLQTTYGVAEGLLHGDLHPGNVLLGEAGPVLIDWTNASTGVRAADVADTWTLVSCFKPGKSHVEALRAPLLDAFLHDVDVAAARPWLENVARQRLGDPNTSSLEAARIKLLCRQNRDEKASGDRAALASAVKTAHRPARSSAFRQVASTSNGGASPFSSGR